jgi:hypothetical protein
MTSREAIIVNPLTKHPILDLDPINIEVDVTGLAIGSEARIMDLWDSANCNGLTTEDGYATASLVWSDDRTRLRFLCPMCDEIEYVDDATQQDFLDGHTEMVCSSCSD